MLVNIGTDPEFFVRDKTTKEIVSFSGRFGHTKENPKRIRVQINDRNRDFLISEDNVAIEFATSIAWTVDELIAQIKKGFELVNKILDPMGLEIAEGNNHFFSDEELSKGNAWEFGCEPDFCVYKLKPMVPPPLAYLKKKKLQNMRTTGGHVHVGCSGHIDKILLGRMLDFMVGKWTIDKEPALPRRILYGRAGAIRMKNYGVEYRTPGNFWLLNEDYIRTMYNLCSEATMLASDPKSNTVKTILEQMAETKAIVNGVQDKAIAA